MIKQKTISGFQKGMTTDLSPMTIPQEYLTDCLNGTFITNNGNELILQNDMGNARVETAFLPEGYVPVGTTEFGGIIYIASHNPFTNRNQIGSFPSPERNFVNDKVENEKPLELSSFFQGLSNYNIENKNPNDILSASSLKLILTTEDVNPGDKFKIFSKELSSFLKKMGV